MLRAPCAAWLLEEAEALEGPVRPPNSMNRYGTMLADVRWDGLRSPVRIRAVSVKNAAAFGLGSAYVKCRSAVVQPKTNSLPG